jgi:hypothetical protein
MPRMLRNLVMAASCGAVLMLASTVPAAALVNPTTGHNGAPNNTCGSPGFTVTPGSAANARGSAFNPNGIAGLHYAGNPNTSSLAHSNSTASVAQYDTACVRLSGK